jgi:hypothetical protein
MSRIERAVTLWAGDHWKAGRCPGQDPVEFFRQPIRSGFRKMNRPSGPLELTGHPNPVRLGMYWRDLLIY